MSFSQNTMQQVINYLVTKPYNEVANLIATIAQEDEANKKAAAEGPTPVVEPVAATTELREQEQKAMGE